MTEWLRRLLGRPFVRFCMIGGMNTLLDLAVFLLLVGSLGVFGANFVSTSCGMAVSLFANARFTFGAGRPSLRQGLLFIATTGSMLWLVQPLVILGLGELSVPLSIAKITAIAVTVVGNFVVYRYVVWPPSGKATSQLQGRETPE